MVRNFVSRLTYANVMATVALFVAIGGGAYAAGLARNSVGSKQIKDGKVKSVDIADDSLTGADINESKLALPDGPSSVVASPHNHTPGTPSPYPSVAAYPLDDATWTQSSDSINVIYGRLEFDAPAGCSGGDVYLNFSLDGDGQTTIHLTASDLSPVDLSEVFSPVMNTGPAVEHTLSVEATQMACEGGGNLTIDGIDFGVVEYR